jgi:hypothetical protein
MNSPDFTVALARQALEELRHSLFVAMSEATEAKEACENASITSKMLMAEADRLLARR